MLTTLSIVICLLVTHFGAPQTFTTECKLLWWAGHKYFLGTMGRTSTSAFFPMSEKNQQIYKQTYLNILKHIEQNSISTKSRSTACLHTYME